MRRTHELNKLRTIWLNLLLAVAALIAVGTVTAVGLHAPEPGRLASAYLVVANAFLVFATMLAAALYADSRRARIRASLRGEQKLAQILRHLAEIASARTTLSLESLEAITDHASIERRVARTNEFLLQLVNETRKMFEEYTDKDCAASIKLLIPGTNGIPNILTYMRDDSSRSLRERVYGNSQPYPYTDHSPFVDIIRGRVDYYLDNDLRQSQKAGVYANGNKEWSRFYNATLVIPISSPGYAPRENIAGFLCVDSKNAEFDEGICVSAAKNMSSSAFLALYELSVVEGQRGRTGHADEQGAQTA